MTTPNPVRVSVPDLTPRQARVLVDELKRVEADDVLTPWRREFCGWLAREIHDRMVAAMARKKGRVRR